MRGRWTARRIMVAAALLTVAVPSAAFVVAVLWPRNEPAPPRNPPAIAIVGTTVVDLMSGALRRGQTIVIEGDRIVEVAPEDDVRIPSDAYRIDGTGRFVLPALWDMHTHVYAVSPLLDLALYVAYGVTHVRDMQGCPAAGDPFIACYEDKKRWSREVEEGTRIGPRIVEASSFMANGPGMAARLKNVPAFFDVATPEQARQFVRHFVGRADTIKVYDNIPREAYFALADEARRQGLPVVGHRPRSVSALEAARHQRSLEHARFPLHESFDGSARLRADAGTPAWREERRAMVDRHDPALALRLFEAMREAGTYYVPTHLTRWADAFADRPDVREDPALVYLHPLMRMQWLEDLDEVVDRDPTPEGRRAYADFYRKGLELTRQAHDAGVKIMVGSDYVVAGLDVHRELEQLVLAGLSPRDALRAATVIPAEYAGRADRFGQVAPGRTADLLVLDADPLVDIRHTRRLHAVVAHGVLYDAGAIAGIKDRVRSNARSWSVGAKILWRFIRNPASY